ncbi:hypothetical protein IQ268_11005 [Oculatella sp. LEGE 06141]|uniref:hypothetical protein n=1 Tax=Oculatella sp. LEGE 06141 TaxID=1828648 RepID=UPI001881438C|nr:hypothetical protein [Oculatella sp. LEGE 06141]MBE9179090.1 hypothetical protein [Oculatella sp. LEGE 06141]
MNDRDEQLRHLIETVQQHSPGSLLWRKAMNRLLLDIQQLPGLARSAHPDYGEALNDVLMRLGDEIRDFEPRQPSLEKSLTAWINLKLRLKYEVRDLYTASSRAEPASDRPTAKAEFRHQSQKAPLSLDAPMSADGGSFAAQLPSTSPCTLWELDEAIQQAQAQQQRTRIGMQLQHYINDDPEGRLRSCHPQAHPDCHCQMLSQRMLLQQPPDRLAAIAREFNINYHTLNWHWKNRGLPLLQTIAKKMGYLSDRTMNS